MSALTRRFFCTLALTCLSFGLTPASLADEAAKIRVLLVDGQNNHNWVETTPVIKRTLEASGRFTVDVATSPANGQSMDSFDPVFSDYDVVVSNYNGDPWSKRTQRLFEKFVAGGKGFVSVHAADNSFSNWDAYNRMIGLGGWGGRDEKDGPYVRWKEDVQRFVRDRSPGKGGARQASSLRGRRSGSRTSDHQRLARIVHADHRRALRKASWAGREHARAGDRIQHDRDRRYRRT